MDIEDDEMRFCFQSNCFRVYSETKDVCPWTLDMTEKTFRTLSVS